MKHAIPKPVELEREDDCILKDLLAEAAVWRSENPGGDAQAFIDHVGRRRWMSNFADHWNIPEDEQLYRFQINRIDRFLADGFAAAEGTERDPLSCRHCVVWNP